MHGSWRRGWLPSHRWLIYSAPTPFASGDGTTLQRRRGALSNRIEPALWDPPPAGTRAFCLGSDEPGYKGRFRTGDGVRVAQTGTLDSATFIGAKCRIRGTVDYLPDGWRWLAYCAVLDTVLGLVTAWELDMVPGMRSDLLDAVVPTRLLGTSVELRFGIRAEGPGGQVEELEIPALYVDDVQLLGDLTRIYNRIPADGDTDVLVDAPIRFDAASSTADIDVSSVQITVNDELVYDGGNGGAQGAWTVDVIPLTDLGAARFVVTPPAPWPSLETVSVNVQAADTLAVMTQVNWTFTVIDAAAPVVASASAIGRKVVRVVFDEAVLATDPAQLDDALNFTNYSFSCSTVPHSAVEAVEVSRFSGREVDVLLNTEMTPDAVYTVTVSGVVDLVGNEIAPPDNIAEFAGYRCPQPRGRDFQLWKLIPAKNRREDDTGDLRKFFGVLQDVTDQLLCDVDDFTDIFDVDVAAERYVDHLLIYLGNPFDFELELIDKRRLARILVPLYKAKGTARGIIDAVRFFVGVEVEIRLLQMDGWILGDDELGVDTVLGTSVQRDLYSFEIVSPSVLTDAQRDRILTIADYVKPAHTHIARLIEPEVVVPIDPDHVELGLSELGENWQLH